MLPVIAPKKDNLVNNGGNSNIDSSDSSTGNIIRDNKDDVEDDIKDVTLGDFSKFVRIQDSLEKQIEKRNLRNQPGISFGEKLGMKIEERVSDGFIDKMLGGMFKVEGSTAKPDGWLAIVKTVLDSGFAQQAGSKLPETIEAMGKTFGKQRTEQLADAVIQAVGPKKNTGVSTEDEQRKMEEFVLSLNHVNIVDIKKFMDLVNANPANAKITDINIARDVLIEEQNRIRKESKLISPGQQYIEENPDIDRGDRRQRFPSQSLGRDNLMDSMMPKDISNMTEIGNSGMGSSNQMTSEQILSLDPYSNESITAYAWSQGHGQMLQEPNGLNKIKNMLMRHQDDLMRQASGIGLGGTIEQPGKSEGKSISSEGVVPEGADYKWGEEDIGKKGKIKMNKEGEILVPPHIVTADSPVAEDTDNKTKIVTDNNNSIMELLQRMAGNFDSGINEMNNNINVISDRLQIVEDRINKIEYKQDNKIEQETETIDEQQTDVIENDQIVESEVDNKIDEKQEQLSIQESIVKDTKDTDTKDTDTKDTDTKDIWWKNKKDDVDNSKTMLSEVDTSRKYAKGSMGWLKQKKLKEQTKKYEDKL